MQAENISLMLAVQMIKQSRLNREFAWLSQEDSLDSLDFYK